MEDHSPPSSSGHRLDRARPLEGRSQKFGRLLELLAECVRSQSPRMVTVLGASGIGKTRLVQDRKSVV